ncbi:tetratricopeptide repeat-containing sensor histidine kinase [Chitinophaga sp. OAE865]|uniref:ATP-binding protein n=1 Tax=Chitinophaga sp. OAE865 TaxID=2817898 RepID=UPI001AE3FA69
MTIILMSLSKLVSLLILYMFFCSLKNSALAQSATIRKEQGDLLSIKDSVEFADKLNRIGILFYLKDVDSCFYYGMKAKVLSVRLRYAKGETDADNVIAAALYFKGLYKEALELFNKCMDAYRELGDSANVAQVLSNMSTVYTDMGDSEKAISFARQGFELGQQLEGDSIQTLLYLNYCLDHPELPEDTIRHYLAKARVIADKYNDQPMQSLALLMLPTYMVANNRRQEALPLIRAALEHSRNTGMEYLEISTLILYGNCMENKPDSALIYYTLAYQIAEKNGYKNFNLQLLNEILKNTELVGNKDQIIHVQKLMASALEADNSNLKKFIGDYTVYSAIREENDLLEAGNRNKLTQIWMLVGICSAAILLLAFIYYQYRRSRQMNKIISDQNHQLQNTLAALEQSQADNTQLLKIVAHDLRNPIGAMTSIASLMLDDGPRSDNDRMLLELLKTSGENSLDLVSNLLLMHTRAEELTKEPVEMYQLLQYCVALLQFKAKEKMQRISLTAVHVTIRVNREKIWRVVSNLITNAIKFSPNGARISVLLELKNGKVQIRVKDEGIGIPEDIKDNIFDMFTISRRAGTAGEQSFGLGLSISRQIVEAHGGAIWYESTPGNGTVFFVELPLETA